MTAKSDDDWSLRLFLFSPGGVITMALLSFISWTMWAFSDREILITSLEIDEQTIAYIYEDNYCDQARIPTFQIFIDGKPLPGRYSTFLWLECGREFKSDSFRVVTVEPKSILGVFYDYGSGESLAFAYDKEKRLPIPEIPEFTQSLLYQAAASTYSDRRTKR